MISADRLFSVYMVKNKINGKVYVGATRQIPKNNLVRCGHRYYYAEVN